jgi:hypothetical protein
MVLAKQTLPLFQLRPTGSSFLFEARAEVAAELRRSMVLDLARPLAGYLARPTKGHVASAGSFLRGARLHTADATMASLSETN